MEALLRNGMPFDLYYLDQPASLHGLGDYRVLVLPYPYSISNEAAGAIRQAAARGTRVVAIARSGEVDEFGDVRKVPSLRAVAGVEHITIDLARSRYHDLSRLLVQRVGHALGSAAPLHFDAANHDVECSVMEKDDDRLLFCLNWESQALDVDVGVNVPEGSYDVSIATMDRESPARIGSKSIVSASDLAGFRLALEAEEAAVIVVHRVPAAKRG